jgi:hypothetical protein
MPLNVEGARDAQLAVRAAKKPINRPGGTNVLTLVQILRHGRFGGDEYKRTKAISFRVG